MPKFTSTSLRHKLIFWMLILLLPVLIVITFRSYFLVSHFTNQANDRSLMRIGLAIANQVNTNAGKLTIEQSINRFNLVKLDPEDKIFYHILDHQHQVIASNALLKFPSKPLKNTPIFYNATFNHHKLRMVAMRFSATTADTLENTTILVGETVAHRAESFEDIIIFFLITQSIILILAVFAVKIAIKRGLVPLEKLTNLIAARTPLDTTPIIKKNIPTELQPLIEAMNVLLKKINESINLKQQFIANAAHQLKTPIAGLKLQAETALNAKELPHIQHALKKISAGSNNLARLTNQLLSLAKAEASDSLKADFKQVDLVKLVQETVAEWVPMALNKQIELGFDSEQKSSIINGNPLLLQELINNLIDNATRYNPANTIVNVQLHTSDTHQILTIEDDGIGIPAEEQSNVFHRFYRPLGTAEHGCGLGLSIVEEIVKLHGATIDLSYADVTKTRGTRIDIYFKNTAIVAD